ncbi:MAG: TetR/AcrR family transcriptional regulator [Ilumatobacter sp.]|uniref:TetR/AcrR family transcriptional regulator n=1 Tax=Ilumatobacter sp. TaxID=1967498 RepID=UPI00262ADBB7|nr:TetR/AcrR family transcriptional regulator [Ilumatobacter sp.]MDJ0771675.1 TetR/AcrR family transcriptional regulator [Ilumatobacter sp.]
MTSDTSALETAPTTRTTRQAREASTAAGAASTRGRPRSADTTEAILEATHELLKEHGYDHLRMQDVADRAGSGLATIYRRWGTKPELVAAAIQHSPLDAPEPTGDAEADLRAMVASMVAKCGEDGEYLMSFLQATRDHAPIGEVVRSEIMGPMRERLRELMTAVAGHEPASVEFVIDAVFGAVIIRTAMLGQEIDPDTYGDEVIELLRSLRS